MQQTQNAALLIRSLAIKEKVMESKLLNTDCIDYMRKQPDLSFDLAIVDPPYNVGASDGTFGNKGIYTKRGKKLKHYANHNKVPGKVYFDELFRISVHQIIFGMNYFPQHLYHSGAIIWDKKLTGSPMSECEIAFQSFNKLVRKCECEWNGFLKGGERGSRIHPNQKPIALYQWLFEKFTERGQRVIDTHLGSGSSAIAAHYAKLNFVGCELDETYYALTCKRVKELTRQLKLFDG